MASTKRITAQYSSKLDSMTCRIREFLSNDIDQTARERVAKSIEVFCYNNMAKFTEEFLRKVGISELNNAAKSEPSEEEVADFTEKLARMQGECLFLLKDTYSIMRVYQEKTNKGYGLLINRNFLCRNENEEDYFTLIQLMYDSLKASSSQEDFVVAYKDGFTKLISLDLHFYEKSREIYEYVKDHGLGQSIVWVDMGFQFTFVLFCLASVDRHSKGQIVQDYYCFTTYPWLQQFFQEKYFSEKCENALDYELWGIKAFKDSLIKRAEGSLVGFAIGDSLGFPIAGIDTKDVSRFITPPIEGFLDNPKHPYFSHLHNGNYTDNTIMLILSTESLIKNNGLTIEAYAKDLAKWGEQILSGEKKERWAGPTALTAIKQLVEGKSYTDSGSTVTESCSSTYRVVPLGIFNYALGKLTIEDLKEQAATSGGITHNSEVSRTGAVLVALILSDLMVGVPSKRAIEAAVQSVGVTSRNEILINRVLEAIHWASTASDDEARRYFGTGSPIYQTLPLAIFYFLKYQNDFKAALFAAANSFRDDTPEEKERIKDLSWEEQLIAAKGGNADGIAGLTGTFMGAYLGLAAIPQEFRTVEDFSKLKELGERLVA